MSVKTGLILAGGGARAAYQVGVLRGVAALLPPDVQQPFPIITGTSAGAINALGLAGRSGSFRSRTRALAAVWASLDSDAVYRTDAGGVMRNGFRMLWALLRNNQANERPLALLDNSPLRQLLNDIIEFKRVDNAIAKGELEGLGITAMNYTNGHSTTFYQAQDHVKPWARAHRRSVPCQLTVDHLMASSALPTLFPSVRLDMHFFGDGALRQSRPLSPAIRLGAERLFIIGVSESSDDFEEDPHSEVAPTIPQVLGQMLNAVFLDSIQTDLESLQRINALVAPLNAKQLQKAGLANMRVIDTLVISPSRSLSELAREYISELPRSMRWFLQKTGSIKTTGSGGALSYILFEPGYCQRLMQLGYEDTMAQAEDVRAFFNVAPPSAEKQRSTQSPRRGLTGRQNGLTKRWLQLIGRTGTKV